MMVAREIARRRTASEARIARTAYATVRGRVVAVLRQLAEEHGERLPDRRQRPASPPILARGPSLRTVKYGALLLSKPLQRMRRLSSYDLGMDINIGRRSNLLLIPRRPLVWLPVS